MKNILFLLLVAFTSSANAENITITHSKLSQLETHYKDLIASAVNFKLKNSAKQIDPKYLDILSSCHLAGISAWPVDIRIKMLEIYNKNSNINSSIKSVEKYLDSLVLSNKLSIQKMTRFVDLQSVIYDGCAKQINSEFWRKSFLKSGMVDYYL